MFTVQWIISMSVLHQSDALVSLGEVGGWSTKWYLHDEIVGLFVMFLLMAEFPASQPECTELSAYILLHRCVCLGPPALLSPGPAGVSSQDIWVGGISWGNISKL